jgi:ribosomal-protein-alanine N-acetyltransferase
MLAWERQALPPLRPVPALSIRPINLKDLPVVEQIDRAAFMPVWQNSQDSLEQALRQSAFSTLAEINGAPVGYQISTTTAGGSHLARLAVLPAYQGRGVGFALLRHMLEEMAQRGARTVTVNTQANNAASLRLYEGIGFMRTGEAFPVYQTPIGARLAAPAG